jgi:altronate dehydratase large subunit
VLVVSLGCESASADQIVEGIAKSGKPVEKVVMQKLGGSPKTIDRGVKIAGSMAAATAKLKREEFPDTELRLGVKCGASDTTSGLTSNPAIGVACDMLVNNGGSCVFGETTEIIGAEHIMARRAATPEVAQRILDIVSRMEKRAIAMGVDMRGGQPSKGNIAGGLSTIEEKSLGAIVKAGTKPINAIYEYGERPEGRGLFLIDSPGREPELLTMLAAAAAQVIVFSTGLGAPQGFPFVPVIKITGNPNTFKNLPDHLDLFVELGNEGITQAGAALYKEILAVASGKKTKAEALGYGCFPNVFTIGPVV